MLVLCRSFLVVCALAFVGCAGKSEAPVVSAQSEEGQTAECTCHAGDEGCKCTEGADCGCNHHACKHAEGGECPHKGKCKHAEGGEAPNTAP